MKIVLILSSVLLNCLAQLLIRKGMLQIGEISVVQVFDNFFKLISNYWLWSAMFAYGISIVLWMVVLSKVEVSYAYPFLSVGYVVSAFVGFLWFQEALTLTRIMGIAVISIGVYLISRS